MIQIFGKAKCFDTRKAERFFKERRVPFQRIDLAEKGFSRGELRSVIAAVGSAEALLDPKQPDAAVVKYLADPDAQLDQLAQQSRTVFRIRPTMRGCDCSLSGIENQCRKMQAQSQPAAEIAAYCIQAVGAALDGMTAAIFAEYGRLPLIFAGGVTSNSWIRQRLSEKYGALFAEPVYSCDNAAGVAYLGWRALHGC